MLTFRKVSRWMLGLVAASLWLACRLALWVCRQFTLAVWATALVAALSNPGVRRTLNQQGWMIAVIAFVSMLVVTRAMLWMNRVISAVQIVAGNQYPAAIPVNRVEIGRMSGW